MDQLFSPWRSQYIGSFKNKEKEGKCVFCEALTGKDDESNLVVYRGELVFVLMNRYPYNSGHLMIIPKRHTSDFQSLEETEIKECMELLQISEKALMELSRPQAFNIGMNLGRSAGAGIADHLHWHMVPRWEGDTNFLPIFADVKVVSEDIPAQWKQLHDLFPKLIKNR